MAIKTDDAQVVAFVSSEPHGGDRWTELRVFHWNDGRRRPWMAEARGVSTREGERHKIARLTGGTLDRVLKLFDDTDMGFAVKEMAIEAEPGVQPAPVPTEGRAALAYLFGIDPDDLSLRAAGRVLGSTHSKLRAAIVDGREINIPLSAILPFIDRVAFAAHVDSVERSTND